MTWVWLVHIIVLFSSVICIGVNVLAFVAEKCAYYYFFFVEMGCLIRRSVALEVCFLSRILYYHSFKRKRRMNVKYHILMPAQNTHANGSEQHNH